MIRIGSPLKTRIQEVRIGEVHSIDHHTLHGNLVLSAELIT